MTLNKAAFDEMAAEYDSSFTRTRLGEWLREVVWGHLEAASPACGRILEIGCGTGEDAVRLAQRGWSVVAVDASDEMLKVARKKAQQAGLASRIDFSHMPMEQLHFRLNGETFDAAFSNFGVLNCAQNISVLMKQIAGLLKPGAPLTCVLMGRHVPWEWVWFLARLDLRRAFRRLPRDGTLWRGMRVRYPTPRAFLRALEPCFEDASVSALGLVLPPSYASEWLEHRPGVFRSLAHIERQAQKVNLLAGLADHYIVDARRRRGTLV